MLKIRIYDTYAILAFAEEAVIEKTTITPPTYNECFKLIKTHLIEQQSALQEQINSGNLPATVEKEGIDVRNLNPQINPAADDVKASLQIDLPQKKEEDLNSPLSQCDTLYGLKP